MKDIHCEDTITAIATPLGKGAIGIVKISGSKSLEILKKLFRTKSGKKKESFEDRRMTYGLIVDRNGNPIDEVLVVYMKKPKTFTGEDVVEIHSHGGIVVVKKILQEVMACGARLAEPGEFTMRAFLNGKIDLLQAEAINDIVNAVSESSLRVAFNQLEGGLSKKIKEIRDEIVELKALLETAVDFPEEDVEIMEEGEVKERLEKTIKKISQLLATFNTGKILKEGIKVVIAGRPNVGKSSLLNAMLQEDRAIVTEIPGTTRDVIEETAVISGVPIRLIDTAGLRKSKDKVEEIGIERTKKSIKEADVVLFVVDGHEGFTDEDERVLKLVEGKPVLLVINKKDKGLKFFCKDAKRFADCVEVSAKTGEGLEELAEKIAKIVMFKPIEEVSLEPVLTNERQKKLLEEAKESLENALASIESGFSSPEIVCLDVDKALESLGKMVGEVTTEDILGIIFSKFCIGK